MKMTTAEFVSTIEPIIDEFMSILSESWNEGMEKMEGRLEGIDGLEEISEMEQEIFLSMLQSKTRDIFKVS